MSGSGSSEGDPFCTPTDFQCMSAFPWHFLWDSFREKDLRRSSIAAITEEGDRAFPEPTIGECTILGCNLCDLLCQLPDTENGWKTAEKGAEWVPVKQPKNSRKTSRNTRRRVKTTVFRLFFRLFFGCLTGTHSAPVSAVFRLFFGRFQCRAVGTSVDGRRDCKSWLEGARVSSERIKEDQRRMPRVCRSWKDPCNCLALQEDEEGLQHVRHRDAPRFGRQGTGIPLCLVLIRRLTLFFSFFSLSSFSYYLFSFCVFSLYIHIYICCKVKNWSKISLFYKLKSGPFFFVFFLLFIFKNLILPAERGFLKN